MAEKSKAKRRRKKPREGEIVSCEQPNWGPLLGLARIYVDEFMWMFEVKLDNGVRLQGYKHYWTRRYLHLDEEGNAWIYLEDGRYQQYNEDIVDLFNLVVRWHYPGQHDDEWKEHLACRDELASESAEP